MPETLLDACEKIYFPRNLRIRCEETKRQYRLAISDFKLCLGREPAVEDLTDDNLTLLYRWLQDRRRCAIITQNERVGRLKALAEFLWRRGLLPRGITVSRLKVPQRSPRAWEVEEVQRLVEVTSRIKGQLDGVPAALWWRVLLAWLWGTGARIGETLCLRWEWVDLTRGVATIPAEARKGQTADQVYMLPPWLVDELRRIQLPERTLVFPYPRTKSAMYHRWRKLIEWAGLKNERRKNHKMRVTHATWIEALGGDAQRALGHSSREVTERHYIDPRMIRGRKVDLPGVDGDPPRAA